MLQLHQSKWYGIGTKTDTEISGAERRAPEVNPHILIYSKGNKNMQWAKTVSLINSVGKTRELHAKE